MKKAIVAGATGILGRSIASKLNQLEGWSVVGLSRSAAPQPFPMLQVDLLDAQDCHDKLAGFDATHLFYAAYAPAKDREEEARLNLAMLTNVTEAIQAGHSKLRKVVLVTGAKYYGLQWGPTQSPMAESDSRSMSPNFYYDQEDYLRAKGERGELAWTNLIPGYVTGFAFETTMNMVMVAGVIAAISKEIGIPLRFPGNERAYRALLHFVDSDQLAGAAIWAALTDSSDGQRFNVTNGDPTRWDRIWQRVAETYGIDLGQPHVMSLTQLMSNNVGLWKTMVEKHGLRKTDLMRLVDWSWAERPMHYEADLILRTDKIRRAGFHDVLDTEDQFITRLTELRAHRILP